MKKELTKFSLTKKEQISENQTVGVNNTLYNT